MVGCVFGEIGSRARAAHIAPQCACRPWDFLLGDAAVPLLPVARGAEIKPAGGASGAAAPGTAAPDPGDPSSCDYWRHCAIDGYLCGCCGGSQSVCPPGTDMSAVTWIGTCHNPSDRKDYVISYNICCGKSACGQVCCNRNEATRPCFSQANQRLQLVLRKLRRPIFPILVPPRASWVRPWAGHEGRGVPRLRSMRSRPSRSLWP